MANEHINPWSQIWIHPRKTLRSILSTNPQRVIIWLALLGGLISSLSFVHLLEGEGKTLAIIAILVAGAILGLIHLYFGGWLYQLTGSWIGGQGSFTDVKCAVGWSNYPFIISSLFGILSLFTLAHPWVLALFGIVNLILAVWGLVIFFNLISEAHRFSIWKGILCFLIAFALIFVVVMIILLIIPLLQPLFQ